MPKKCSAIKKQKIKLLTNKFFEDSVREVMGLKETTEPEELYMATDLLRNANDYKNIYPDDEIADMIAQKARVDELYLSKILASTTKTLQDIIHVHEDGYIRRTTKVFEAITAELTRRALFGDQYQSDTK